MRLIVILAAVGCAASPELLGDAAPVFGADGPSAVDAPSDGQPTTEAPEDHGSDDVVDVPDPAPEEVPFHGLSCIDDDARAWDPTDLCGGTDCDFVLFGASCAFLDTAVSEPTYCLAHDGAGTWMPCGKLQGFHAAVSAAIERRFGINPDYDIAFEPVIEACFLPGAITGTVEVTDVGLRIDFGGVDHVACAHNQVDGAWGGGASAGYVRTRVDPACAERDPAPGWHFEAEGDAVFAVTEGFYTDRLAVGTWAELGSVARHLHLATR